MKLINIKVADTKQSTTNGKGRNEGQPFDDLVASIKEKGVLVPVLARALEGKDKVGKWEVIAGNRRLAAAKEAGLETIPAQIVTMTDIEAREAQIVENLQRQDIHPLEEGELYRKLIEASVGAYETATIAAKVGKAESYVKQRLFLTNLITPVADAYRGQKINDGHAVLIAKLASGDQTKALQAVNSRYNTMTVKELKEWIETNIYSPLDKQPWLKSKELTEAVGKCEECEPDKASLFGPVKEGACTSLKCWARKMSKYIDHIAKAEHRTKVSSEYGQAPKGIKGKNEYVIVAAKGKDRCESVHGAIVAQGSDIGATFDICSNKECKTHGRGQSEYGLTPAEQAKRKADRKKEAAKSKKEKEARQTRLRDALKKLKWPMSEKHLEALLTLALEQAGSNLMRSVAKRHELEVPKEKNTWGSTSWNYSGAVKTMAKGLEKTDKLRLVFELLIDTGYDSLRNGVGQL